MPGLNSNIIFVVKERSVPVPSVNPSSAAQNGDFQHHCGAGTGPYRAFLARVTLGFYRSQFQPMKVRSAALTVFVLFAPAVSSPQPPRAGKVEILKASDVKPGMKAVAWTVFQGDTPEAVPIDIVGTWKNMWGPDEDVILGKMGGKAERTNVAGGMSGSPVYIDGKLIGAVALRLSTFSPDAICGITPIELMLEINEFDKSRPSDAKHPTAPRRLVPP